MSVMQTREQLLEEAFAVAEQVDPLTIDEPGAAVFELRALRLTIAAAVAGQEREPFAQWAQLSLMGHTQKLGLVREISIGGRAFLEVTTPAGPAGTKRTSEEPWEAPGESSIYSTGAVYSIEPMSEERVRELLLDQRGWDSKREDIPF